MDTAPADTAPAELATTGTAPTEPATTDLAITGTAPTDPNTTDPTTTDLATMELATTDTVGRILTWELAGGIWAEGEVDFLPECGDDCRGSGEDHDETSTPEPHAGLQGEAGLGGDQG